MSKIINYIKNKFNNFDFILVTASTVICSGLSFILSVYAKSLVPTEPMGIYSKCLLAVTFMNYAQFGVLNAYNRDYPQALGRKDFSTAQKMKNTAITFMLLIYAGIFVVFETWVYLRYRTVIGVDEYETYYAFGFALCPIIILLKSFDDMSNSTVRMNGRYNYSAIVGFFRTCMAMLAGVISLKLFGYYGLYTMTIVSSLLGIILFHNNSLKGSRIDFDFSYMKVMIIGGLPLLINSLIWTLVQSVDKFVIIGFLNTEQLGVYTVPLMGFTTMVLVPQSISQVFYIKISHLYGANQDRYELIDKAREFTKITAALSGGACVFVFYIMPIFVKAFMPNYADGTVATQILIVGVAIYSTTMIYGNIFSIVKLNKSLIANSVALLFFNALFSTALVLLVGRNINMVAVGTGCSYVLYSLLLMIKLAKKFNYSFFRLIVSSWLPLLAIIAPAVIFYITMDNIWIAAALSAVVMVIVYGVILRRKGNV